MTTVGKLGELGGGPFSNIDLWGGRQQHTTTQKIDWLCVAGGTHSKRKHDVDLLFLRDRQSID